jgi:hypothetical protein
VQRIRAVPSAALRLLATVVAATFVAFAGGCASGGPFASFPDVESARQFKRFPLYWAGETFEGLDVSVIDGLYDGTERISIIYGSCEPSGTFEPSCQAPLSIQITRLCFHLDAVALPPPARSREIRSAPVGTQDGAPVLLTRRAQIKVYRGEGSDPGMPLRALSALRSLNSVPPVISERDAIPPPLPSTLRRCRE